MEDAASFIRLGSFTALVHAPAQTAADIAYIFGTSVVPDAEARELRADAHVRFVERAAGAAGARPEVPPDGMVLRHGESSAEIHTEVLSARIDRACDPASVEIVVNEMPAEHFDFCVHLAVVFHKLLFMFNRAVLHAAAIRFDGRTCVVVGEKGAGKSTLSLSLARAGGTVLGEDHLILRQQPDGFLISGCDERTRVDEKTERYFFSDPLPVQPRDFAGRMKKEVSARGLFSSEPYTDTRADIIFFAGAGANFSIRPLPRQIALLRLMESVGKLQRFVDAEDRSRFLAMLSDFVQSVRAYDLQLSPNLDDLRQLVPFLRGVELAGRS